MFIVTSIYFPNLFITEVILMILPHKVSSADSTNILFSLDNYNIK